MATILAIYAHPDDEVFGTGGIYSKCSAAGHKVHLICATRGESGKITDPSIPQDSNVGEVREQELKDACAIMGIEEPIFLDYHDSGRKERVQTENPKALMNVDEFDIETELLKHIADIKPHVIVTFDPHGAYGHIDHIRIHRAATAAFWACGATVQPAPTRLYYNTFPKSRMTMIQEMRPNSPLGNLDPDLYSVSDDSLAVKVDVTDVIEQKMRAIKAHKTQVGPTSSFADTDNPAWQKMFTTETLSLGGLRGSFPYEMPLDDPMLGL